MIPLYFQVVCPRKRGCSFTGLKRADWIKKLGSSICTPMSGDTPCKAKKCARSRMYGRVFHTKSCQVLGSAVSVKAKQGKICLSACQGRKVLSPDNFDSVRTERGWPFTELWVLITTIVLIGVPSTPTPAQLTIDTDINDTEHNNKQDQHNPTNNRTAVASNSRSRDRDTRNCRQLVCLLLSRGVSVLMF